jgi:hypothetical protein
MHVLLFEPVPPFRHDTESAAGVTDESTSLQGLRVVRRCATPRSDSTTRVAAAYAAIHAETRDPREASRYAVEQTMRVRRAHDQDSNAGFQDSLGLTGHC